MAPEFCSDPSAADLGCSSEPPVLSRVNGINRKKDSGLFLEETVIKRAWDVLPQPPTWASCGCHCGGPKSLCLLAWILRAGLELRVTVGCGSPQGPLILALLVSSVHCPEDWSAHGSPVCDRVVVSFQAYGPPVPFGIFSPRSDSEENTECVPWAL